MTLVTLSDAEQLQLRLKAAAGYDLVTRDTVSAVRSFQATCPDLDVDGLAGPKTLAALDAAIARAHTGLVSRLLSPWPEPWPPEILERVRAVGDDLVLACFDALCSAGVPRANIEIARVDHAVNWRAAGPKVSICSISINVHKESAFLIVFYSNVLLDGVERGEQRRHVYTLSVTHELVRGVNASKIEFNPPSSPQLPPISIRLAPRRCIPGAGLTHE